MPPERVGGRGAYGAFAPLAVALAICAALAAIAWSLEQRSRPDHAGPRFVAALTARHADTIVTPLDGGVVRVAFADGVAVDVRLSIVLDTCARRRFDCDAAVGQAVDDVDATAALAHTPRRAALRPLVVAEGAGYQRGYLATPLVGALERRTALVAGVASTPVTAGHADRLGLTPAAVDATALDNLHADAPAGLERLVEDGATIWRVRGMEPAAALVDPVALARFAATLGTRRLYAVVPTRGTLALGVANDAVAHALVALRARLRAGKTTTTDTGLLLYDLDAPAERRLSRATEPL